MPILTKRFIAKVPFEFSSLEVCFTLMPMHDYFGVDKHEMDSIGKLENCNRLSNGFFRN